MATDFVSLPATRSDSDRRYSWDAAARQVSWASSRKASAAVYAVDELDVDAPARAFQLTKLAGGSDAESEGYAVFLCAATGDRSCECRGFLRWGSCKHLDFVRDLVSRGCL